MGWVLVDPSWITVADNPSGKAVYNGFSGQKGAKYGYQKSRTVPMLVRLQPQLIVQVEANVGQNGLGATHGSVIHTSYSQCSVFYCFIQDVDHILTVLQFDSRLT